MCGLQGHLKSASVLYLKCMLCHNDTALFHFSKNAMPPWFVLAVPSVRNGLLHILLYLQHASLPVISPHGHFLWDTQAELIILSCATTVLFLKSTINLMNICISLWNPYKNVHMSARSPSLSLYFFLSFFPHEFLLYNTVSSCLVTVIDWLDEKMTVAHLSAYLLGKNAPNFIILAT